MDFAPFHWRDIQLRLIAIACAAWAAAETLPAADSGEASAPPSADSLLADVVSHLPRKPVNISGLLLAESRGDRAARKLGVELSLNYGASPPLARYTIRDAFGADLERLEITLPAGGPSRLQYFKGNSLAAAPLPGLGEPIQGTDICWADLTMSFLWWRGGRTEGREVIRDQTCYVLSVPAPVHEPSSYARVKLWIDEKFHVVLQAEGYNVRGELVRRLSAKSFKKINDEWLIKDMDVRSFPSRARTTLRITELLRGEKQEELRDQL